MNQRRETRFPTNQPVKVVVFGSPDLHLEGRIQNVSGRGMSLQVGQQLAPGTAVRIDLPNSILLGEVIYCRAEGEDWNAGVELEHALFSLSELAETLRGFNEETSSREHQNALHDTGRQGEQQAH
jgi:PilZ domain